MYIIVDFEDFADVKVIKDMLEPGATKYFDEPADAEDYISRHLNDAFCFVVEVPEM